MSNLDCLFILAWCLERLPKEQDPLLGGQHLVSAWAFKESPARCPPGPLGKQEAMMLGEQSLAREGQSHQEPPKDLLVYFLRPCLPSQGVAVPWKLGSKQTWLLMFTEKAHPLTTHVYQNSQ